MDKRERRHEDIVSKVVNDLECRGYEEIYEHTVYGDEKVIGEIDVYVKKDDYYLVFEIKGRKGHSVKARKQLLRAEKYFFTGEHCFLFYVHGYDDGDFVYRRIKK